MPDTRFPLEKTALPTTSPPRAWIPVTIFFVMLITISTTGVLLYKLHKHEMERATQEAITAIADLKAVEITRWLSEHHAHAGSIHSDILLADAVERWFQQGAPEGEIAQKILTRLASIRKITHCEGIALVDEQGQLRLSTNENKIINHADTDLVLQAMLENVVTRSDIYLSEKQLPEINFIAPLVVPGTPEPRVIGAVMLNVNLKVFLFPYIQQWPTPSPSSETLIVRREGNEVLYLNELRHRKDTPLGLHLPMDQQSLAAAIALRGQNGVITGVDYRGVAVLSTARKIPDTPWILISKVDRKEVEAPLRRLAVTAATLMTLFILLAGAVTALWWRKQRAQHLAALLQEQLQRLALTRHFEYATKHAHDMIMLIDETGRMIDYSDSVPANYGYTRAELLHFNHRYLLVPQGREPMMFADLESTRNLAEGITYETVHLRKDGSEFPVEVSLRRFEIEDQRYFHVIVRDITERKAQGHRIARLTRIHTVLSEINSTIVRVSKREELFKESCRIAVEHGEFRMAWIGQVDKSTQEIKPVAWQGEKNFSPENITLSMNPDVREGRTMAGQAMRDKVPAICNDIENTPELIYGKMALAQGYRSMAMFPLVIGEEAVGLFSLFSGERDFFDTEEVDLLKGLTADISFALDHLEKAISINYLAYYDVLTGLPNHSFFMEHVNRQMHQARSEDLLEALALVDIERFHNINDSLGRHVGDNLLRSIAVRLQEGIGAYGMLARLEGDRFAFSLSGMEQVADVAHFVEHNINNCFTRPFPIEGKDLRLAARFGIALYPYDGNNAEVLFKNAETALNKAKHTAEHLLFYEPVMNDRMTEMLVLEGKLSQAIEAGQFVLHYQPQVNARTGRITAMEALIRWNDPDTGMVPPNDFIPLLEATGLIYEVGRWVLVQVASDYTRWHEQGLHPPRIAVNISTLQLRRADFVQVIKAVSDTLPAQNSLELEITESLIMDDVEKNIEKLAALRDMGVNTVIDDFGTGYSSLRYIARLPIHAVKIDRGFIVNMINNLDDMTIVTMILSLAHELGLKVIAEGVDTEEQVKVLRLLKCDAIQGFLFSKPLPFDGIEQLLRSGKALVPV
jgi:diguanylate cyclase (GGDEF)-like protein/PAS domain S-box-containing protein